MRRCAYDGSILGESHWARILSAERVRWSTCRRVVIRQPDQKTVQALCYKTVENGQFNIDNIIK